MIPNRAPTFEVRQLRSTPWWYVSVVWQYGQEQHVTGFASADDARIWISRKSERGCETEMTHCGWQITKSKEARITDNEPSLHGRTASIHSPRF
jgi:hypothetical protein